MATSSSSSSISTSSTSSASWKDTLNPSIWIDVATYKQHQQYGRSIKLAKSFDWRFGSEVVKECSDPLRIAIDSAIKELT